MCNLLRLSLALVVSTLAFASAARADILDSETWDNHVEQVMQIQNDRQFRRTMNRGFDAMSAFGSIPGGDLRSATDRAAKQVATWQATLTFRPTFSGHELGVFLAQPFAAKYRDVLKPYMRQALSRFASEARAASLNPNNIADARVFALQAAYRAARPDDPIPMTATLMVDVALSESMTEGLRTMALTPAQKEDIRDYYVIVRALFLPALQGATESRSDAAGDHRELAAAARAFIKKNIGVDAAQVSWAQLPCVGASDVDCEVHTAMARSALTAVP